MNLKQAINYMLEYTCQHSHRSSREINDVQEHENDWRKYRIPECTHDASIIVALVLVAVGRLVQPLEKLLGRLEQLHILRRRRRAPLAFPLEDDVLG